MIGEADLTSYHSTGIICALQLVYRDVKLTYGMASGDEENFAICIECGHLIEQCECVCPYCGERDQCECALFDAATGG